MSELIDKVRSRGHWDIVIRPQAYAGDRVPYSELEDIIQRAAVRMRGWPVPMFDYRDKVLRGDNWVGQDVNAAVVGSYEAWRFYTSGQFDQLRAIDFDWAHTREISPGHAPEDRLIQVWEILFYVTEVFELAARLALTPAGDAEMYVEIALHDLKERGLIVGQRNRAEFFQPYRAQQESLQRELVISREELVGRPQELAVDVALDMFMRFGWKPARDQIVGHQRELLDRG